MHENSKKENNESFAYLTLKDGRKTKVDSDITMEFEKKAVSYRSRYIAFYIDCKRVSLHRYIMKAKKGEIVDHINGDKSDNRRINLRITTNSANLHNIHNFKKNESGYRNVNSDRQNRYWRPSLYSQGKYLFRQRFKNPVIAALVIDRVIKKHIKVFGKLNFPNSIKRAHLRTFLESTNGKCFKVWFASKTTGQMRQMTCKLHKIKKSEIRNNRFLYDPGQFDLINCFDTEIQAYRCFSISHVLCVEFNNIRYACIP